MSQWECYENFMDAISAGDTWITQQGLNIAGYSDKLPSPDIGAPCRTAAATVLWAGPCACLPISAGPLLCSCGIRVCINLVFSPLLITQGQQPQ